MKKYVLAVSVILCTAMIGMAIAQETAKEQQKPDKAPKVTAKAQTGEVVSVDPTKNEIVIKDDAGTEIHLLIGTTTKITRDGKDITLGDVKAGEKVTSECEPSADGCKAKSIVVTPPPSQ
jgi:Cu/Ag efflux protein CusF